MAARWPDFQLISFFDDKIHWNGALMGFQKVYQVGLIWEATSDLPPYVYLINPMLRPRQEGRYDKIPHLLYSEERPQSSGLCLFDPDGNEWSEHFLLADTTIPWAVKWLYYYELWHYDGVWRGGGVGPETYADRE
jgi:hypothetical protein